MRVVLDVNIIVSFLLTRGETISSIFNYWEQGKFTLLVSREIIEEVESVVNRLREKGFINYYPAKSLLNKIQKHTEKVRVVSKCSVSIDKKDNRYIECAVDGNADYLVSGDIHHLLPLEKFKYTKIISPKEFVELLRSRS